MLVSHSNKNMLHEYWITHFDISNFKSSRVTNALNTYNVRVFVHQLFINTCKWVINSKQRSTNPWPMHGKVKTIVAVDRSLHWVLNLGKQYSREKNNAMKVFLMMTLLMGQNTSIGWLCEWPGWGMLGRGAPHPPLGVTWADEDQDEVDEHS